MSDFASLLCGVPQGLSLRSLLKQNLSDLSISVVDTQVCPSSKVRDLGVVFDQYFTFHDHISGTCKSFSLA